MLAKSLHLLFSVFSKDNGFVVFKHFYRGLQLQYSSASRAAKAASKIRNKQQA